MKKVVFPSFRVIGLLTLAMSLAPAALFGQIVQQGGFATTSDNPVVQAVYSPQTPRTRIVPTGHAEPIEPRPLVAQTPQFVPFQSVVPAQHVAPTPVPAPAARPIASESVAKNHKLQHLSAQQFEQKLIDKLGKRFVPVTNVETTPNLSRYRLPVKDGTAVELSIDRQSGMTTIIGSAPMAESCLQIVRLLDVPENGGGTTTEFLPVQQANLLPVKQAATILNRETNKPTVSQTPAQTPKVAQVPPAFQPGGNEATARFAAPGSQLPADGVTGSIVGPLQVNVNDDLGILTVVGSRRDVEAFKAMIAQIETTSLEHEPVIELVPMKHADSYRISQMVQQLYAQVYQPRKGNVLMLPLVKPNTILIVGRKESNDAAKELIAKLDTEVDPASEFLVIRLKNASSDSLQTQIQQVYAGRSGMGLETQVTIVSDYRTNSLIVQGSPRDLTEVAAMALKLDTPGSDALNTVKTFPLKNAMASDLATTLQNAISGTSTGTGGFGGGGGGTSSTQSGRTRSPMITMNMLDEDGNLQRASVLFDVRIVADTRSNTLIVTAPSESMPLIEALVKELDQLPSAESQIKVFTLVNGDASTLTTMLTNLFATTSSGTGGFGGGTSGSTSQIATVRPGIEEGESTLVSVRFQAETRTNSIVACGSAGDMAVVEALLVRLDEDNMNNRKVMVIKPLNTPASDIATAIQNYMTNERQLETQNSSTYYPQSPQEQYRKEVVVVSEEYTNTLIISTTPRYFEQIRQLVAELDDRPLMVAIQVLIAEVKLNNNRELGVELGLQDSLLFDRSIDGVPGFLFGDANQNLPLGNVNSGTVGSQGITSLGVGRTGSSGYGGFTFSASSESVSVLIRALEERNRVRVLSRPHLTTMHNLRGSLQVGERVPYVKNADTNDAGGMTSSTELEDVGIILDVTPRIAPDGLIVMDLYAEKSYVGSDADGIPIYTSGTNIIRSPKIHVTKAQTTVSAQDGETIVFAGLITEEKETVERGVPFLNRIPVVKHLFEYKSTSCIRNELLIIMTPTIIRSEMDMQILKRQEASRMHWCLSDVVKLTGNSTMRMRDHHWSPQDAPHLRGEAVILDTSQLPAEEKVRMLYPNPTILPDGDR